MQKQTGEESTISLDIADHEIGFIVPAGARMQGRLHLPCGALILGEFVGEILCARGSLIIKNGARARLIGEADRVYVEGNVASLTLDADTKDADQGPSRSVLIGRQVVAAASSAECNADMYAPQFAVTKGAKVWGRMLTIEDLKRRPRPPLASPEPGKLMGSVSTSDQASSAGPIDTAFRLPTIGDNPATGPMGPAEGQQPAEVPPPARTRAAASRPASRPAAKSAPVATATTKAPPKATTRTTVRKTAADAASDSKPSN